MCFKNAEKINPHDFVKLFNTWIPESPEIFIDVADYQHVKNGPVIYLAGYHTDYILDHSNGRLGLMMNQKSSMDGDSRQKILGTFIPFLKRCQLLQDEFVTDEIEFMVNDRALVPNEKKSFDEIKPILEELGKKIWGGVVLSHESNPRIRFAARLKGSNEVSIADMIKVIG